MSIHIHVTESSDSRQLDRIEQKIEEITNQLKSMKDQQEEHDELVEEILGKIQEETKEIKAIIESLQPGKPISLEKLRALKDAVSGMSEGLVAVAPTPVEGKHNITMGFRSKGEETMSATLVNNGADDDQAASLRGIFDGVRAASDAQESGGAAVDTTFTFTDNGKVDSFSINDIAKKAAADVALNQALLEISLAQLAAFKPVE